MTWLYNTERQAALTQRVTRGPSGAEGMTCESDKLPKCVIKHFIFLPFTSFLPWRFGRGSPWGGRQRSKQKRSWRSTLVGLSPASRRHCTINTQPEGGVLWSTRCVLSKCSLTCTGANMQGRGERYPILQHTGQREAAFGCPGSLTQARVTGYSGL